MIRSDRWINFVVVLIILGVILRLPMLVALAAALFVVLGMATWWKNHSLDGILYRRRFHYSRGFPQERTSVRVEVENRKILPLSWLRVQDTWPKAVGPEAVDVLAPSHLPDQGFLTNIFSLRWYERARRTYEIMFRKRGIYTVGPALLESGDLFGFYEKTGEGGRTEFLTVFPDMIPLKELGLPAEDPFGDMHSRRRLFEDPNRPMGVREYRPEDEFRRVHWPATARTGQIQVKVYQPTSAPVMVICLNIATFSRHWEGFYPALLEHLVRVAATLANQGLQDGYRVGMISNGCLAHADQPFRIPPGRTSQQLVRLLEALAAATPLVTGPFELFLLKEAPKVPYGSTLVVLTGIHTPELAETLLKLKQHERRVTLISLAEQSPQPIPGVTVIHMPFQEQLGVSDTPEPLTQFFTISHNG